MRLLQLYHAVSLYTARVQHMQSANLFLNNCFPIRGQARAADAAEHTLIAS